jgi:hypothetical protein
MSNVEKPSRRSPWPVLRTSLLFALASTLALGAPPREAGAARSPEEKPETASWAVLDTVTTIGLNPSTLSGLGLEMTALEPSVTRHVAHRLSVMTPEAPSFAANGPVGMRVAVAWDGFHGFEGGPLRHRGGFRLRGPAGTFDLMGLEVRPGKDTTALELYDATGVALFTTGAAQWELDTDRGLLRYLNADLRILPALARRLGDERYTGVTVGLLDLDATLRVGRIPPSPPARVGVLAPPPCGDWATGQIDVGLVGMSSFSQAGISTVNGRSVVVVLPSAELENVGTANVPWFAKFTNTAQFPFDQHPFLVWQMARINGGVIEPLGRSDLKHAFLTVNSGCDPGACTSSNTLGIGCADVYGTGTNNSVGSLAPRSEVTASTGVWSHCGGIPSHFDTNGDCTQDFSGAGENAFTHGLKAAEADLQLAGSTFFVEAFYIVRNDINIFNSMGYRQVAPTKPGSTWSFPTAGAYTQGPVINAWVNPTTPGADADNRLLDTGEGKLQLAVKVLPVVGNPNRKRFVYALQNLDFDRRIKSLHIPFNGNTAVVENIAYADGDGFASNDWTAAVDATGITWTAPASVTPPAPPGPIDYATLVSFRFDSDQAAAPAQSTLGIFEAGAAGSPTELTIQTLAPATGVAAGADYHTLAPCRLLDTRTAAGGAAPITSGTVYELLAAGSCGVPAGALALAINVTALSAPSSGDIAVYGTTDPPATAGVVSFGPGINLANNAISMLTADGKLKIKPTLTAAGSTHVIVDVVGYFILADAP